MFTCKFFFKASDCIWNLQFSTKREKFRADCWIFGPPSANINSKRGLWNAMREQYWDGSQVQQPWRREPRDLPPGNRSWAGPSTSVRLEMTYCDPWLSQRDFKWREELARQNRLHFSQCFLKQAEEIRRKDWSLLHLIQLSQEWKLFNCCYYFFLYFLIVSHHPESTDVKQKLETAFIQAEGHPNIALLTGGLKHWQLQKLYSWSSIPQGGNNILMVLILFGIVKIRKGYGAEAGTCLFFLRTKKDLASSLVSLECHFQPFETVSDYPCGN